MEQPGWLVAVEASALSGEPAPSPESAEGLWLAVLAAGAVLAFLAGGFWAWRRHKGETPAPMPPPDWLSSHALAEVLRAPVGPETPEESQAYRLARLLIGELKEFSHGQIELGLRHKDLYARLKEDLDRSREAYLELTPGLEKDFLQQEILYCLAREDPTVFG